MDVGKRADEVRVGDITPLKVNKFTGVVNKIPGFFKKFLHKKQGSAEVSIRFSSLLRNYLLHFDGTSLFASPLCNNIIFVFFLSHQ